MRTFSERKGLKGVKTIVQLDSMDDELRAGLWNALKICYWDTVHRSFGSGDLSLSDPYNVNLRALCQLLWDRYFKLPLDTMSYDWPQTYEYLRTHFFNTKTPWNQVYDFVEFVPNSYPDGEVNRVFREYCNKVLERELSGYRFVGGEIIDITSKEEIEAVEKALETTRAKSLKPVNEHLESALSLLADRKTPDYRNSIKESISAVEAAARVLAGDPKAELGQALKTIKNKTGLHPALERAFTSLYGYTSDADGIRHALADEAHLNSEDARFMLVVCSAFVNYLVVKSTRK